MSDGVACSDDPLLAMTECESPRDRAHLRLEVWARENPCSAAFQASSNSATVLLSFERSRRFPAASFLAQAFVWHAPAGRPHSAISGADRPLKSARRLSASGGFVSAITQQIPQLDHC